MDPGRLKAIPLFQSVSDEALTEIGTFAQEASVEQGKELGGQIEI